MSDRDQRGYQTPIMADVETGFRRLMRFEVKFFLGLLVLVLIAGGVIAGIVIAHRNQRVAIPDVRGLDNVGAASSLDRAGLAFGYTRLDQASTTVPFGHVIATDPRAGTRVKRGTVIKVVFSCGTPQPGFCSGTVP